MTTATQTRSTYWHRHPRGFANECDLYRCETADEAAQADASGYERLTVAELRRHVKWINGENDAWGSNRAFGNIDLRSIEGWSDDPYTYRNRNL